jgi:hypothetical protein
LYRGYIAIFAYVLTIYLRFTSSIILPLPPLSFLEQFQQVLFFYFHLWIQNTFTIFTLISLFLVPTPLPLVPTPGKDLLEAPI